MKAIILLSGIGQLLAQDTAKVSFARDVQPIFKEHCIECHGASQQMRGLRLDRRRDAIPNRVGANRASIVPGNSSKSPIYLKLTSQLGAQMPPSGALRPELIATIKNWIDQGAEWPDALSQDAATTQPDPAVVKIASALRQGDKKAFAKILSDNPDVRNKRGDAGWTPLMFAALYNDTSAMRLLLEKGADPNLRNDAGGTALMFSIESPENVRLLLEHGAKADTRSGEGRTALLIAANRTGSTEVLKLLLDHGADVSATVAFPPNALAMAAIAGDAEMVRLLLDRGVPKKPLPLFVSLLTGCSKCFEMLLPFAEEADLSAALSAAVRTGDADIARALMERGARAMPTALTNAVQTSATVPPALFKSIISGGADVNGKIPNGGTVLDLAKRQGDTAHVSLLMAAGAKSNWPDAALTEKPKPAASARAAVERSLPPIQRADAAFLAKAGCVSCHNNSLAEMAMAAARKNNIPVNDGHAREQVRRVAAFLRENSESGMEAIGIPGGADTVGYIVLGLSAIDYPADGITDIWAYYLKNRQFPDGHWGVQALRPPLESSDIEVTTSALRSLQKYAPPSRRKEYAEAVRMAVQWLEKAQPRTNEDGAFQILGLTWGGGSKAVISKSARELLASQRADGGWSQLASLKSDAYATGQSLVALGESGALKVGSQAYRNGVKFLMNSQLEDGSWYVRSRTMPFQPQFDSEFPHGPDQFISAAATSWAAMALAPVK